MKQLSTLIRSKVQLPVISGFLLLCITVFLMSFPRSWSLYSLGLSMIAGLILWLKEFKRLKQSFSSRLSQNLPPLIYFLIILLNCIFRTPEWKYLEGYFMFLLIPLFCFPLFNSEYFNDKKEIFIKSFIYGILLICLFEFLRAATGWEINTGTTPDVSFDPESYTSPFRSQRLSFLEHPTYLSIKVLFAVTLIIITRKELRYSLVFSCVQLFCLLAFIYFLSSRTIYLASIILSIYFLYSFLKRYHLHLLILILAPLILYASYEVYSLNPRVTNKTELLRKRYTIDKLKFKDLDPRFTSWITSADIIKEHPVFGIGLNSRNILADRYRKNGFSNEANLRLNAHNQFLETQLALGIPGSLVLLWMLFAPLFKPEKLFKPALYYSFLIILITSFLFESVLERQWGIMFYTIFYCFQVNMKPAAENTSDKEMVIET